MYYIKRAIYGPNPQEEKRACDTLIRKNIRELDKQTIGIRNSEMKTRALIKQCVNRQDMKSAKLLAREIIKSRKHCERLELSKAQLNSVKMQVAESFALYKVQGSMHKSIGIMKEVNRLIRLPEIMGTMQQLSKELMKAGIIDEIVSDTMESWETNDELEDETVETQVDSILNEILQPPSAKQRPARAQAQPAAVNDLADEEEEDEETINDMRERLKALQT